MKLTFPHMGNTYISVKALLDTLGVDYYIPPIGSRKSFDLGIANSPEFMCLPFKTVLGDLIQGLNHGADTILFGNSCGQCRLSQYGDLLQKILYDMGYKFNYINLNFKKLTYNEIQNKLGFLLNGVNKTRIFQAVTNAVRIMFETDELYARACHVRCREICKGETDGIMRLFEQKAKIVKGFPEIHKTIHETKNSLSHIYTDDTLDPVKIGIVGEIFISSDPFTNFEIEKKLGNMGALVLNTMSTSEWIRKHFVD